MTFVCLSATVANAEELRRLAHGRCGARPEWWWRRTGLSPCTTTTRWPRRGRRRPQRRPPADRGGRPNREADGARTSRRRRDGRAIAAAPRGAPRWPSYLAADGMLPAITFIFSRAACDDATQQCLRDGLRLTTVDGAGRIREITEAAVEGLRRRPPHPRLRAVVGRARGGHRPPSRRPGPGLPASGRVVLLGRPVEGGVRHRDAGPGDQHAGPHRGGRALRQVPGLGDLAPHLGRVPQLTGRAGRRGHRHRRSRHDPLLGGDHLHHRGPHGRRASARSPLVVSPHLQPGRQPCPPVVRGGGPRPPALVLRAVAGVLGIGLPARPSSTGGWPSSSGRVCRRLAAHRGRSGAGRHLPRVRPPGGRGPAPWPLRRPRALPPGRGGLRR